MGFKSIFLLSLSLTLFSSQISFAGISGRLMQIAATHDGHRKIENHLLVKALREKKFRREQVAQFFQDRIYILQILEHRLLADNQIDQDPAVFPKKAFYRSEAYQKDLEKLMGRWTQIEPSDAALNYGAYLSTASDESAALHLWLFLIGETFGAQHISHYINAKYKDAGDASQDFGNLKLLQVRGHFNRWIDQKLNDTNLNYEHEIQSAFEQLHALFEDAYLTPHVSPCRSTMTAISQLYSKAISALSLGPWSSSTCITSD